MRAPAALAALVAGAIALAGCAGADAATDESGTTTVLTVSAAASLQDVFDEIAAHFESDHPGVVVQTVYDGSSTLATQIIEGSPVDVFASANETTMQRVVDAGLATDPALFATNTLVIAVPAGNPAKVSALDDLAEPGLLVVLCDAEVPCGAASQQLLDLNGVSVTPASSEQNVTAVLTKVAAGEADAGLVYATDVAGRGDVEAIVPEGADEVVNRYPIAALSGATHAALAQEFVDLVLGASGQETLATAGFGAP
ncbi:molybdate ABC transporter substrate-binding protein [Microbacterium sediminicola]|uniref:Molybdate ABC transporter substrate-binding protein n=1 Tax=Microbacterium sediminicola TaxID=415210 RepID=A0ABP4U908_9MICO